MAVWMKWTLAGLVFACIAVAVGIAVGTWRQRRITAELIDALVRQPPSFSSTRVAFESFDHVPAPVARFFRRVLRDGQPVIRTARFTQSGQLRTDIRNDRWSTFAASQTV